MAKTNLIALANCDTNTRLSLCATVLNNDMIFAYCADAGIDELNIQGELFNYLIKARRHKQGDIVALSALDSLKHNYLINSIHSKHARLVLQQTQSVLPPTNTTLHLAWCVIDNHIIKQTLPALNQLGLNKLTFVYAQKSQRNIKLNLKKLEKILISSCGQCGRYDLMKLAISPSIEDFLHQNPQTILLNFNATSIKHTQQAIDTIMVGSEGGFTNDEVRLFSGKKIISLVSFYTLKSETAAISVVSQLLA